MNTALYLKDVQLFLDHAKQTREPVTLTALKADGTLLQLDGWICISGWWTKGYHDFRSPVSGQIRKVRDVLIFNVNGHPVYI
ncbi:MAG: hypothetical protein II886_13140 [Prevotella sp.]|nr:hypothetical protein [Prevotella sp.]